MAAAANPKGTREATIRQVIPIPRGRENKIAQERSLGVEHVPVSQRTNTTDNREPVESAEERSVF